MYVNSVYCIFIYIYKSLFTHLYALNGTRIHSMMSPVELRGAGPARHEQCQGRARGPRLRGGALLVGRRHRASARRHVARGGAPQRPPAERGAAGPRPVAQGHAVAARGGRAHHGALLGWRRGGAAGGALAGAAELKS